MAGCLPFFTTSSMNVQGVSLSITSNWTCRVYHVYFSTTFSVNVQGVSIYVHRQQFGRVGCIHLYRQQCLRESISLSTTAV